MPTAKLTERFLAAQIPAQLDSKKDARVTFWDTELSGFGLTVGPRGKVFVARRWVDGRKVKITIGQAGYPREDGHPWTVLLARKRASELLGQMAVGKDPGLAAKRGGATLHDGLVLHLANMRKKHRSARSIETIETEVPKYLADWLERPMVEMTGADLHAVHEKWSSEGKLFMANRIVAHVSTIWNALDKLYQLEGRNPARGVTRNNCDPSRERIDDEDLPAWFAKLETLSPVRRDLQVLILFTGMRSEAARKVRWEHVDLDLRVLRVPKPKGGEERAFRLPLCDTVIAALCRRQSENPILMDPFGGDAGWCFPSWTRKKPFKVQPVAEPKEYRRNKETGEKERILPGPHTLRRTYTSVASDAGVSKLDRQVLINHAFGKQDVHEMYITQAFGHLAECQAIIEAALWKRIKARQGSVVPTSSGRGKPPLHVEPVIQHAPANVEMSRSPSLSSPQFEGDDGQAG